MTVTVTLEAVTTLSQPLEPGQLPNVQDKGLQLAFIFVFQNFRRSFHGVQGRLLYIGWVQGQGTPVSIMLLTSLKYQIGGLSYKHIYLI